MEYKIFVSRLAIEKAVFQCQTSLAYRPPVEKGGFLIGRKLDNGRLRYVDSIHSPHAQAAPGHMVFTHDDWEFAEDYLKSLSDSNLNIYGWYHSHPGYGIFLSGRDEFIVEHFFNKPWNLALVVDPVKKRLGFFVPVRGKINILCECEYGIFLSKTDMRGR